MGSVKNNPKTLVFIDDSGDPGFKFKQGSSIYFIISAVIFNDTLEAEKTAVAIKELRRKEGFPDNFEFKFNKSQRKTRERFFNTIKLFDFKIRYLIVDKRKITSAELKNNKKSFYSYIIKMLLKHSNNSIINASIKIDGGGDKLFRKSFLTYLKKSINSTEKRIINNLKFSDSKENVLIQLADMVAGSELRYFEHRDGSKNDFRVYRDILKNKIDDEWEFN